MYGLHCSASNMAPNVVAFLMSAENRLAEATASKLQDIGRRSLSLAPFFPQTSIPSQNGLILGGQGSQMPSNTSVTSLSCDTQSGGLFQGMISGCHNQEASCVDSNASFLSTKKGTNSECSQQQKIEPSDKIQGKRCPKPRATLTSDDAVEIYKRSLPAYSPKRTSATAVAHEYRVSEKAIRDIWTGRTWSEDTRHLDPHRAPRTSRPTGRPLGKRDSAPRKRRACANEDNTDAAISQPPSANQPAVDGMQQDDEIAAGSAARDASRSPTQKQDGPLPSQPAPASSKHDLSTSRPSSLIHPPLQPLERPTALPRLAALDLARPQPPRSVLTNWQHFPADHGPAALPAPSVPSAAPPNPPPAAWIQPFPAGAGMGGDARSLAHSAASPHAALLAAIAAAARAGPPGCGPAGCHPAGRVR